MTMYTIKSFTNPVHDFVHEFIVSFWYCVVFYNITANREVVVFKGNWHCAALSEILGFRASLSAERRRQKADKIRQIP